MKALTTEQIESIEFEEVGDGFTKKLVRMSKANPFSNAHGCVRINGEYYRWVSVKDDNKAHR